MGELSRCLEALESWPDMPAGLIKVPTTYH